MIDTMKLAFYQAALLSVAAHAAATQSIEEEASYFPDLLVQTASIVDYFYPQIEEELSAGTTLAQTSSFTDANTEVEAEADVDADIDADVDADLEAELSADAELEADVDADVDAEVDVDAEAETELSAELKNQIELECEGEAECMQGKMSEMTRIKVKDDKNTDVSIEMPAMEKKKITFDSPTLVVEDDGFNQPRGPVGTSLGGKGRGLAQTEADLDVDSDEIMGAAQVLIEETLDQYDGTW